MDLSLKSVYEHKESTRHRKPRRKRVKCEIGSITLTDFIKEETIQKDQYSIRFRIPSKLGIKWRITQSGRVLVCALFGIMDTVSPAQACQLIQPGDELIRANDNVINTLDDLNLVQLISSLDRLAKVFSVAYRDRLCLMLVSLTRNRKDYI
jgi:hypothetical protein